MHYLGLALWAEGKSDYSFLSPLLLRLCESLCTGATQPVDIGDVIGLDHAKTSKTSTRAARISEAAKSATGSWNILFVHADADGDPVAALHERALPGIDGAKAAGLKRAEGVAVIPVRETEAWALADGEALRSVFGTTLGDTELGLNARGAGLERLADPKKVLDDCFAAAHGGRRRSQLSVSNSLNALGEQVTLHRLMELPSFAGLHRDLGAALQRLNILS